MIFYKSEQSYAFVLNMLKIETFKCTINIDYKSFSENIV